MWKRLKRKLFYDRASMEELAEKIEQALKEVPADKDGHEGTITIRVVESKLTPSQSAFVAYTTARGELRRLKKLLRKMWEKRKTE